MRINPHEAPIRYVLTTTLLAFPSRFSAVSYHVNVMGRATAVVGNLADRSFMQNQGLRTERRMISSNLTLLAITGADCTPPDAAMLIRARHGARTVARIDLPAPYHAADTIKRETLPATPGLIDCPAHVFMAATAFEQCLDGTSYSEFARVGGGSIFTVSPTSHHGARRPDHD